MKAKKDYISIKLMKGGKQSKLSYNSEKKVKNVGSITNTLTETVRTPINHTIRTGFVGLKVHMLRISGHWNPVVETMWNEKQGGFKPVTRNESDEVSAAVMQMKNLLSNLEMDYLYYHGEKISIGGRIRILDGTGEMELKADNIRDDNSYEFYAELMDICDEVFTEIDVWSETVPEKRQMLMEFIQIDQSVDLGDAEVVFNQMSDEDKDKMLLKHLEKYTKESELGLKQMGLDGGEEEKEEKEDPIMKAISEKPVKVEAKAVKAQEAKTEKEEDPFKGTEKTAGKAPKIDSKKETDPFAPKAKDKAVNGYPKSKNGAKKQEKISQVSSKEKLAAMAGGDDDDDFSQTIPRIQ